MDEKMKKTIMYLGLGGLAVWYLFLRKKKGGASDEEMSNFFSRRARKKLKGRIKKVKGRIKKHIRGGGVGGAIHRKLKRKKRGLINRLRESRIGRGRIGRHIGGRIGRLDTRRHKLRRKIRKGGFFGGNLPF